MWIIFRIIDFRVHLIVFFTSSLFSPIEHFSFHIYIIVFFSFHCHTLFYIYLHSHLHYYINVCILFSEFAINNHLLLLLVVICDILSIIGLFVFLYFLTCIFSLFNSPFLIKFRQYFPCTSGVTIIINHIAGGGKQSWHEDSLRRINKSSICTRSIKLQKNYQQRSDLKKCWNKLLEELATNW